MNNIKVSEEERLRIKCSQLEVLLAQEKVQQITRSRDKIINETLKSYNPGRNVEDYTFDLENGVFSLKEGV